MSHHLHFGPGFHHPHRASRVTSGAVLLIIFALVVVAIVITSGVNALPGH